MTNTKPKCPYCRLQIIPNLKLRLDGTYEFWLENTGGKKEMLQESFLRYLRWVAEGKKPNGAHTPIGTKGQCYYDDYHCHVKYDPEQDNYEFSLQIYDSPDGDMWWRGRFTVWGGFSIDTILEEKTTSY